MTEEERLRDLEEKVTQLRIAQGEFAASASHLAATVERLERLVGILNDTMNKGRGALWLAMVAAGGLGAATVTIARRVLNLG